MEKNLILQLIIIIASAMFVMRRLKMIRRSEKVLNDFLRMVSTELHHTLVDDEYISLQEKEREEKIFTLVSRYKTHLPTLLASISVFPKKYKYANGGAYIKKVTDKLFDLVHAMYLERKKGSSIEKIEILYIQGTKSIFTKQT